MKTRLFSTLVSILVLSTAISLADYQVSVPGNGQYTAIANHLNNGGNTLNDLFPVVPDGTLFLKWDCVTGDWDPNIATYYSGIGWDLPGVTLSPGEGAFIVNPEADFTVTFTGTPVTPVVPTPLACGCDHTYLLSSQTASIASYESIVGAPPKEGSLFKKWDSATSDTVNYTFTDCHWVPNIPSAAIGESVFVYVPCATNAPPCPCVTPPFGMSAWWPFDETNGPLANDIAGAVNNLGTYNGVPIPSGGVVANALCFSTTNDFVVVSNQAEINFSGDCTNGAESFTIDAWIRADVSTAILETILDKRTITGGTRGYSIFLSDGKLGCQIADGSSQNYGSLAPDLRDAQWHFIAWTLERCATNGNAGTLYVDGNVVATFVDARTGNLNNSADLQLGRRDPAFGDNHYSGCVDELEFFKRALSQAEIQSIYNAESAGKCKSPCPPTNTVVLNTGYDQNNSTVYPIGVADAFWTVVSDPNGPVNRPATVIQRNPAWSLPMTNSQWISSYPTEVNSQNGEYVFETYFCLQPDASNVVVNVCLRADDAAGVYLNGNLLAVTPAIYSFRSASPTCGTASMAIDPGWFVTGGQNVIQVRVTNLYAVAMGLNLSGSVTGDGLALQSAPCCRPFSGISGQKFYDLNGNGVRDHGEPPLAGWTINLAGGGSTVTDSKGYYYFQNLAAGCYTVTETPQANWTQTAPAGGVYNVTLGTAQQVNRRDFGNTHTNNTNCVHIFCPSNIVTECTDMGAVVPFTVTATNLCSSNAPVVFCSPPSSTWFPVGTTTVDCTAYDPITGNYATCSFTVTVVDNTPPVIQGATNIVVTSCTNVPVTYNPTASDSCCDTNAGSITVVCTPPSGSLFAPGSTTVQCVAVDCNGNTNNASFTVTVDCCPPEPLLLFNTGVDTNGVVLADGEVDPHYGLVNNPDGGGSQTYVVSQPPGAWMTNSATSKWIGPTTNGIGAGGEYIDPYTYQIGFNVPCTNNAIITGRWAADDEGYILLNGNPTPVATVAGGNFSTWNYFTITSGLVAGANTLDFYVTNEYAWTGLRVELSGTADCCPTNPCFITLDCATNSKTVSCGAVWSFDAPTNIVDICCTNYTLTFSDATNSGPCPLVITRTWLVSDVCGNSNTCSQTVTVEDTTPPVITCASNKVVQCGDAWTFDAPGVSDNCSGTNVTLTYTTVTNGLCPQVLTRTWVATDLCGNTNACGQTVTVVSPPPPRSWTPSAPMATGRGYAAAELLPSGKVLVVGGATAGVPFSTAAAVFNPALNGWVSGIPSLPQPHRSTSARLLDNRVLVAGDDDLSAPAFTAYLYDEVNSPTAWLPAGNPNSKHINATLTLLNSGNVLLAGGYCGGACVTYDTAEIYNPVANTWTTTNHMINTRHGHTATLLPSGKVLVAGGAQRDSIIIRPECELFQEGTVNPWSQAAPMNLPRASHTATLLPNGKVLVVGGMIGPNDFTHRTATTEIYDPTSNTWTMAASTSTPRSHHTATLLACGKLLIIGGLDTNGVAVSMCEIYDYENNSWSVTTSMSAARYVHTATLLPSGQVFVAGGAGIGGVYLASSEIYTPDCCCDSANKTVACGTAWSFDLPSVADLCCGYNTNPVVVTTVTNGLCPQFITRTWLFTNACGYSNTCSQTVTVVDTTAPAVTAAQGANATIECPAAPSFTAPVFTDICGGVITPSVVTVTNTIGCTNIITQTWTAADPCGNTTNRSQVITVRDTTTPVFTFCPPGGDLGCNPAGVPAAGTPTVTDGCGTPVITSALGAITTNGCDRSQTRTYTATDACGNAATCAQTFTWTISAAQSFDAAADFSAVSNPAGVWSYGWSATLGGSFILDTASGNVSGIDLWLGQQAPDGNPSVQHNGTGSAIGPFQPGQLAFHPGPTNQNGMVRFTAPLTGSYCLAAAFSKLNYGETDVHVLVNSVSIFDGISGGGPNFSTVVALNAGDTVDFSVGFGPDGTYFGDTTGLAATLTAAPVINASGTSLNAGCNPTAAEINAALGTATATDICGSLTSTDSTVTSTGCGRSQTRTWTLTNVCCNAATPVARTVTWTVDTTPPVLTVCVTNRIVAGNATDDFVGSEPASPSAGLVAWLATNLRGFDYDGVCVGNQFFAHTFAHLPPCITAAKLRVRLRSCGGGNDGIWISFADTNGVAGTNNWSSYIGSGNGGNAVTNTPWTEGTTVELVLDLAALPTTGGPVDLLAELNARGYFDLIVQDDTVVDYAILDVTSCCCNANVTVDCGSEWGFAVPTAVDECCTNVTVSLLSAQTNGLCPQVITWVWRAEDCCANITTCTQTVTVVVTGPSIRPVIVGSYKDMAGMHIIIPTQPCYTYALECKNSLTDPTWNICQTATGDGTNHEFIDPPPLPTTRFYRVRLLCP